MERLLPRETAFLALAMTFVSIVNIASYATLVLPCALVFSCVLLPRSYQSLNRFSPTFGPFRPSTHLIKRRLSFGGWSIVIGVVRLRIVHRLLLFEQTHAPAFFVLRSAVRYEMGLLATFAREHLVQTISQPPRAGQYSKEYGIC